MKKDVAQYVSRCLTCQKIKAEHKKSAGFLKPLPIPEWKWEEVTIDFVTRLPPSQTKKDTIWVVVGRLIKTAHFIVVNVRDSMEKLVWIYTQEVVRLHGMPSSTIGVLKIDTKLRDLKAPEGGKVESQISLTLSNIGKSGTSSISIGLTRWIDWNTRCVPHITVKEV
jgi:hypothetical protein